MKKEFDMDVDRYFSELSTKRLEAAMPSDGVKIIELYNKLNDETLNLTPDYQRKLVWKKNHKVHFIETILMNFPFPEVYIASEEIDVVTMKAMEVVVDGKQRLSTIKDYIDGRGVFSEKLEIPSFQDLPIEEKKKFLNYKVTVRDLKDVPYEVVKRIFQRINSTEYALNKIELINSQYGESEFLIFSKMLVDRDFNYKDAIDEFSSELPLEIVEKVRENFLDKLNIFENNDQDRMYNLLYIMNVLASSFETEYYGRNTKISKYLKDYNEQFQDAIDCLKSLNVSLDVLTSLDLDKESFLMSNQSVIFSYLVEASDFDLSKLDTSKFKDLLLDLERKYLKFLKKGEESEEIEDEFKAFFNAARNSNNEKKSREIRGRVIKKLFEQCF